VLTWLTCVECGEEELSFVVDSLGPTIVPLLEHALAGTDTAYRANLAWQFGTAYDRNPSIAFSRDDYIARFIANYDAMVQRRAAAALGALGERRILERVLADSARHGYRSDVMQSIRRAVAQTAGPQMQAAIATVEIVPGDVVIREGQAATLAAVVRDDNGTEISTAVTWASANPAVVAVTPLAGQQATVTGIAVGAAAVTASEPGGEVGSARVTVLEAAPADLRIVYVSGSPQAGPVDTVLAQLLVVRVVDLAGTEQAGVQVEWTFPDGGGTFTSTNSSTATSLTGGTGEASIQVRLGSTPGLTSVNASIGGAPVRFRLRAT
jgi:hypothetical protein